MFAWPPLAWVPCCLTSTAIGDGLQELERYLADTGWRGRENELVNLFAMGNLLPRLCPPMDPTQIAVEVAIRQVDVSRDGVPRPKRSLAGKGVPCHTAAHSAGSRQRFHSGADNVCM